MHDEIARKYGPWALVAGSARGIGRAFCAELVRRGLNLIAVDVLEHELEALATGLRGGGSEESAGSGGNAGAGDRRSIHTIVADLSADDAAEQVVAGIGEREVGLLVYCAAHIPAGRFVEQDRSSHVRAVAVNARTPLLLTHALAAPMRARGRGGIVLVSSMAALQGTGWVATYAATKAFEMILAESLWWELKDEGVDVMAVLPGATDTEGLRRSTPYIEDPAVLAKPEQVAIEAIERLGQGPSFVSGENNRALAEAMRSLTREQAIDMMSSGTRLMAEGPKK